MKCSSRRNCNCLDFGEVVGVGGLNEVQLPKELQLGGRRSRPAAPSRLNEVQLPKDLQPGGLLVPGGGAHSFNEVQLPKELQHVPDEG